MWIAEHEPLTYTEARWALQPKDWLRARLTGEVHAEPSDASATLLYDVMGDRWDREVVDGLGLDASLLAPLLPSAGAPAGHLVAEAGTDLGLPAGIPVAGGHSIDSPEPIYGLAVIGTCKEKDIRRNADARPNWSGAIARYWKSITRL